MATIFGTIAYPTPEFDGSDADPIAAYLDGYQQSVEMGWPSPAHIGTPAFEQGLLDGSELRWGTDPSLYAEAIIEYLRNLEV